MQRTVTQALRQMQQFVAGVALGATLPPNARTLTPAASIALRTCTPPKRARCSPCSSLRTLRATEITQSGSTFKVPRLARARRPALAGPAVTIAGPTSGGWTFEAQLEEDEWHMLWLNSPNSVAGKHQGRYLLSAVFKIGSRIVSASPGEQAMLDAHGLGSGRVMSGLEDVRY